MRKHLFFLIGLGIVGLIVLTLFMMSVWPKNSTPTNTPATSAYLLPPLSAPSVQFGNPIRGAKNAKITIVEFADFACGPCGTLDTALQKILKNYPSTVRLVWKDLPNSAKDKEAAAAANAARCADDQGAFWAYHDYLFANQDGLNTANYRQIATTLGLDVGNFTNCLDKTLNQPIIDKDIEEAIRLRIDATPYLFINGQRLSGAVEYEDLKTVIDGLIALPVSKK